MNYFFPLLLMFLALNLPRARAVDSEEFLLNAYLNEQAFKTLGTLMPKGEFLVQTTVSLKAAPKDESVSLPLGAGTIHLSDLQDSKNLPLNNLLQRIMNIKVQVSVANEVPDGVKKAIQSALTSSFYLNPKKGDRVDFQSLPEGWQAVWHPQAASLAAQGSKEKPDYTLAMTLGSFGFALILVLFTCFQRLQKSISNAVRDTGAAIEKDSAPAMPIKRGGDAREDKKTELPLGNSVLAAVSIGTMDLGILKAFITDSFFVEEYRSIGQELLSGMLPYELSCNLEDSLPPYFLEDTESSRVGESEIKQLLFKYLSEYRKFSKSPLHGALIQLEPSGMIRGFKQLTVIERLITLQNVGPLFREKLLETITPKDRLQLFNEVGSAAAVTDSEKMLSAINAKLAQFYRPKTTSSKQAFSKLSKAMLHPFSFEEDQAFFGESKVTKEFVYTSVLEAFEIFDASVWSTLDLHLVSLVYAGYSVSVREQLLNCFEGKRRAWLKSLFSRMSNQEKLAFASFDCTKARMKVIKLIAEIKTERGKNQTPMAAA